MIFLCWAGASQESQPAWLLNTMQVGLFSAEQRSKDSEKLCPPAAPPQSSGQTGTGTASGPFQVPADVGAAVWKLSTKLCPPSTRARKPRGLGSLSPTVPGGTGDLRQGCAADTSAATP